MEITRIEPQKKRQGRYNIFVDDEFRLGVSDKVLLESGLAKGDVVDDEKLRQVEAEEAKARAKEKAYHLLEVRARSEKELTDRLRKAGHEDPAIEAALADLARYGYIDDEAFARAFVSDRVRLKPRGRRYLINELRQKGISPEMSERVIDEVLQQENTTPEALATQEAEGWIRRKGRGDGTYSHKQKLYAHLARRGFSPDAIREALEVVWVGEESL